jgi:hypothetical protein
MQVQLVWDEARWSAAKPVDAKPNPDAHQPRWPELAYFNCASCHHELAEDRARPDRAASAAPGRPMIRSWPTALYEVVLLGAGITSKADEPILKPLETALARNPFGRAKEVAAAAEKVALRLDAELAAFEAKPLDRVAALAYLQAITTVGLSRPIDYEEARQLAWAAQTIVRELKTNATDANGAAASAWEPIERTADELSADLHPMFPRKPPKEMVGGQVDFSPVYHPLLLDFGAKSLEKAVKYDESEFRRKLETLKKAVAQKT